MKKSKVLYLNVTADSPHVGCLAVTYAHVKNFFLRDLTTIPYSLSELKPYWKGNRYDSLKFIENSTLASDIAISDLIVINGEGTIHHNRGLHLLSISEFCQLNHKPVFLINSTIQEIDGFDEVFKNMYDIVVREESSFQYLKKKKIPCRLCVDDFVNADFNLKSNINFENKIITTDWHPHVEASILPTIQKIQHLQPVYTPMAYSNAFDDWQNIVENYKTASLVIASRYHSIYAAGLAGKPFIALPTNSHKTIGLIKLSKLPLPYCSKSSHILNQIKYANNNPTLYAEFKDFLDEGRGDVSFKGIDDFLGYKIQSIDSNLASTKTLNFLETFRLKAIEQFNQHILKRNIKDSKMRIQLNQQLVDNYYYADWLNRNKTVFIETPAYLLNAARSYYAVGDFAMSKKFFEKIKKFNNELGNRHLSEIYIELGESNLLAEIIDVNTKKWDSAKFLFYIDTGLYAEAWELCIERESSQIYFKSKKHFFLTNNYTNICIILEGGVGDQIRHTLLFNAIKKKFTNVTIACDKRIHALLKRNFKEFDFIEVSNVEKYDNICPIIDLYTKIPPETLQNKSFLTSHNLLHEYWYQYLKKLAKGKKIIGICQGSHIYKFNRVSNIFNYDLWQELFDKYSHEYIFINLLHNYQGEINNIITLPINLLDDFENISAVISNCNFVITPANTILDLCGALNKKTFSIYTGYKFRYRIKSDNTDLFHDNTRWIGSKECFDKKGTFGLICSEIDNLSTY